MSTISTVLIMVAASAAHAKVALPPINLGDSGFHDGVASPGLMLQQSVSTYRADRMRDEHGAAISPSGEVASTAILLQASYLSHRTLWGAYVGVEAIVPLARVSMHPVGEPGLDETAVGDLFVSPLLLQWPERSFMGRPFWQRANFNVTLPTGAHDTNSRLNIGFNAWRFNPHYAFTWEASPAWELSGRLHYLWVATDPSPPRSTGARRVQAGSAFHINASASRSVSDHIRLGASGYFLQQLSSDRVDGADVGGRERAIGAGPAMSWRSEASSLQAAVYWETHVKNRSEGMRVSLRFATFF